jgi:hypothetical protein
LKGEIGINVPIPPAPPTGKVLHQVRRVPDDRGLVQRRTAGDDQHTCGLDRRRAFTYLPAASVIASGVIEIRSAGGSPVYVDGLAISRS